MQKLNDTTLFQLGYSVARVGWQARMKPAEFGLKVPVADVHGPVRATFATGDMTADHKAFDLAENGFYCARNTLLALCFNADDRFLFRAPVIAMLFLRAFIR